MATFEEFADGFTPRLRGIVDEVLGAGQTQGSFIRQLAFEVVDKIVLRSRRGFGVRTFGAPLYRFPRLSRDYIEDRREAKSIGLLSSRTSIRRSNITFTGQMLESIRAKDTGVGRIEFLFNNPRAEAKALQLHQNRRPFFFLSRSELNFVRTEVDAELVKQIAIELADF